jgi:hypothetical protein
MKRGKTIHSFAMEDSRDNVENYCKIDEFSV